MKSHPFLECLLCHFSVSLIGWADAKRFRSLTVTLPFIKLSEKLSGSVLELELWRNASLS